MRPPGRLSLCVGVLAGPVPVPVPVPVHYGLWAQRKWKMTAPAWRRRPATAACAFSMTAHPRSAAATTNTPTANTATAASATADATAADPIQKSYFLSNGLLDRLAGHPTADAPHRRRQRRRATEAGTAGAVGAASSSTPSASASSTATADQELPENASSILSDVAARQPHRSTRRIASSLLALAKPRLTVLVVLSAMAPYALYPVPAFVEAASSAASAASVLAPPSLSPLTLLFLTTGTALCSAAANALNMLYEPDTDARMTRTRNRPLVRQLLGRRAALAFAVACGLAGVAALHLGVNGTVAFLGAANIALYAGVYTPMKRLSVLNTWVGAIVGGIPPLMGWAAAAGETATGKSATGQSGGSEFRELLFAPDGSSTGGWLLAALLVAWQFPHFMALSWSVRAEYQRAGLRMLCWVNPARNGRVALRYSLAFVPICLGLCAAGVTEWSFAVTSLPVNLRLVRDAYRFWQHQGYQGSARVLFWTSVWHLPGIMVLALLQKKGMWARVYRSLVGAPEENDEYEDDEYDWVDEKPAETAVPTGTASTNKA